MKNVLYYVGLLVFGIFLLAIAFSPWLNEHLRQASVDKHDAIKFTDVYVHHGDFKHDVAFHPGDVMFAHYTIKRLRTCKVTIQFRLTMVRENDLYTGIFSYGYPLTRYYAPPSNLETNEYLMIPLGMPAGSYELRRLNFIECGSSENWTEFSPPAPLIIEPN